MKLVFVTILPLTLTLAAFAQQSPQQPTTPTTPVAEQRYCGARDLAACHTSPPSPPLSSKHDPQPELSTPTTPEPGLKSLLVWTGKDIAAKVQWFWK